LLQLDINYFRYRVLVCTVLYFLLSSRNVVEFYIAVALGHPAVVLDVANRLSVVPVAVRPSPSPPRAHTAHLAEEERRVALR
jgi:hypothetical protein